MGDTLEQLVEELYCLTRVLAIKEWKQEIDEVIVLNKQVAKLKKKIINEHS